MGEGIMDVKNPGPMIEGNKRGEPSTFSKLENLGQKPIASVRERGGGSGGGGSSENFGIVFNRFQAGDKTGESAAKDREELLRLAELAKQLGVEARLKQEIESGKAKPEDLEVRARDVVIDAVMEGKKVTVGGQEQTFTMPMAKALEGYAAWRAQGGDPESLRPPVQETPTKPAPPPEQVQPAPEKTASQPPAEPVQPEQKTAPPPPVEPVQPKVQRVEPANAPPPVPEQFRKEEVGPQRSANPPETKADQTPSGLLDVRKPRQGGVNDPGPVPEKYKSEDVTPQGSMRAVRVEASQRQGWLRSHPLSEPKLSARDEKTGEVIEVTIVDEGDGMNGKSTRSEGGGGSGGTTPPEGQRPGPGQNAGRGTPDWVREAETVAGGAFVGEVIDHIQEEREKKKAGAGGRGGSGEQPPSHPGGGAGGGRGGGGEAPPPPHSRGPESGGQGENPYANMSYAELRMRMKNEQNPERLEQMKEEKFQRFLEATELVQGEEDFDQATWEQRMVETLLVSDIDSFESNLREWANIAESRAKNEASYAQNRRLQGVIYNVIREEVDAIRLEVFMGMTRDQRQARHVVDPEAELRELNRYRLGLYHLRAPGGYLQQELTDEQMDVYVQKSIPGAEEAVRRRGEERRLRDERLQREDERRAQERQHQIDLANAKGQGQRPPRNPGAPGTPGTPGGTPGAPGTPGGGGDPEVAANMSWRAAQEGINKQLMDELSRKNQVEAAAWFDQQLNELDVARDAESLMKTIRFARDYLKVTKGTEPLVPELRERLKPGESELNFGDVLAEKVEDRFMFINLFDKFEAAGKDEVEGFGPHASDLAKEATKVFDKLEGERRATRMWKAAYPTMRSMEGNRDRLRRYLDSTSAGDDYEILTEIANETMGKSADHRAQTPQELEELRIALGKVRFGIKFWRLIGRQAMLDANIVPLKEEADVRRAAEAGQFMDRGVFRRHDKGDKKLAQLMRTDIYFGKKHTGGNPAMWQVIGEVEMRDMISFNLNDAELMSMGLKRDSFYRVQSLVPDQAILQEARRRGIATRDISNLNFEELPKREAVMKVWFEDVAFAAQTNDLLGKVMDEPTADNVLPLWKGGWIHLFDAGWDDLEVKPDNGKRFAPSYVPPLGTDRPISKDEEGLEHRKWLKYYQVAKTAYLIQTRGGYLHKRMLDAAEKQALARKLTLKNQAQGADKVKSELMYKMTASWTDRLGVPASDLTRMLFKAFGL